MYVFFSPRFFLVSTWESKPSWLLKLWVKKNKALRDLENGISYENVAEKYGMPKNLTWLKYKEKLLTVLEKSSNKRKKVGESNYPDIDNVVFEWFV